MKYFASILLLFPIICDGKERGYILEISNTTYYAAYNSPVVVTLNDIPDLSFNVVSAKVSDGENTLPCQLDDIDDDGINDELCFLYDLDINCTKQLILTLSDQKEECPFPTVVYADMMLDDKKGKHPVITRLEAPGSSYLFNDLYHHGVAFESLITGYRIYFDERQNIDLYGKKEQRLELSATGFYTTVDQLKEGYGNDVLWAGNSIGCGSLKLWVGETVTNWTNVATRCQSIKSVGPVRTVVEISDRGVLINGASYNIKTLYSQYSNHRDLYVDVFLSNPINEPFLCTGVQKIGSNPEAISYNGGIKSEGFIHEGLAASWGSDYPELGKKELFPPEAVGLAVKVDSEYLSFSKTDELNYLLIIGKESQQHLKYYISFCADKEKNGYHNANEWFRSLDDWHPCLLSYKINKTD